MANPELPEHDVITGQLSVTVRLTEPQPCEGPKLYALGNERPKMAATGAVLSYTLAEGRWSPVTMVALGRAVEEPAVTATIRREWNRSSADLPPAWLSALMRAHRPTTAPGVSS